MPHYFTNANKLFHFMKLENHQHKNFLSTTAVSIVDSAVCMENNLLKKSFCNYIQIAYCISLASPLIFVNIKTLYRNDLCKGVWLRAKQSLACQQP